MPTIGIHCNNDKIWNLSELIRFLNQHQHSSITIDVNPEAPDLAAVGIYDILEQFQFESVTINTSNPFERHDIYQINRRQGNEFLAYMPTLDDSIHQWNHKKVFLTLFGRPTAGRLAIAAHVYQRHRTLSHVHFNSLPNDDNIELFEFDKLAQYEKSLLGPVAELLQNLPMTILPTPYVDFIKENIKTKGQDWTGQIINDPLTTCYRDIFVDCVSESHALGRTFFPTEKITRPIWCKKPFIVFGSRDYLLYLRQMGFQTFQEFWNEDYDGYEGRDRLTRIIRLIDWIGSQSQEILENMYQHMQPILEHNYNLLSTQTYTTTVREVT
jgi:hypothetical protein